jgi:hypothetical protein
MMRTILQSWTKRATLLKLLRGFCFYRLWIVMAAANARTEAAIITRSGFTVDFADFAIAVPSNRRKCAAYFLQMCF